MSDIKRVVHYIKNPYDYVEVGEGAELFGVVDHPNIRKSWVWTSRVLRLDEDGSFETLNTIYKPVEMIVG